jgi:hypothetical protein
MMEVEALINPRKVAWLYVHPEDDGTVARLLVVMLRRHARSALLSHRSGNMELQVTITINLRAGLDEILLETTYRDRALEFC